MVGGHPYPLKTILVKHMGESFQDFEADFPQKVSLKMLNQAGFNSF